MTRMRGNGGSADAPFGAPDAPLGTPDAPPGSPDANLPVADATPGTPDAMTPDAPLPPDAMVPDAAGCTTTWVPLLQNAGFESGATIWTTTTNAGQVIRQQGAGLPWPAQTGTWAAIIGGADDAVQTMTQQVTVPASATALRLSYYGCYVTEEITSITEYDTLDIQLQTTGGTTLETLVHLSNLDAGGTCSWTSAQVNATSTYAGQTIQLDFDGSTDFSNISTFGFDTLVLEALALPVAIGRLTDDLAAAVS